MITKRVMISNRMAVWSSVKLSQCLATANMKIVWHFYKESRLVLENVHLGMQTDTSVKISQRSYLHYKVQRYPNSMT